MNRERCFNARPEEIRSYLAGTLTEVRRAIRPQPDHFHRDIIGKSPPYDQADFERLLPQIGDNEISCPFGRPGDALVFRETWQAIHVYFDPETGYGEDFDVCGKLPDHDDGWWDICYKATDPQANDSRLDRGFSWRSSATMLKWAARIRSTIASVKAERVGDGWEWVIGLEARA